MSTARKLAHLSAVHLRLTSAIDTINLEIARAAKSTPAPVENASIWMMKKGAKQTEYAYLHIATPRGRIKKYIGRNAARVAEAQAAIASGDLLTSLNRRLAAARAALQRFDTLISSTAGIASTY